MHSLDQYTWSLSVGAPTIVDPAESYFTHIYRQPLPVIESNYRHQPIHSAMKAKMYDRSKYKKSEYTKGDGKHYQGTYQKGSYGVYLQNAIHKFPELEGLIEQNPLLERVFNTLVSDEERQNIIQSDRNIHHYTDLMEYLSTFVYDTSRKSEHPISLNQDIHSIMGHAPLQIEHAPIVIQEDNNFVGLPPNAQVQGILDHYDHLIAQVLNTKNRGWKKKVERLERQKNEEIFNLEQAENIHIPITMSPFEDELDFFGVLKPRTEQRVNMHDIEHKLVDDELQPILNDEGVERFGQFPKRVKVAKTYFNEIGEKLKNEPQRRAAKARAAKARATVEAAFS